MAKKKTTDPKEMTDEELNEELGIEEPEVEEPEVPEVEVEEEEAEEPETPEEEEEDPEEALKPSRREQLRIQKVLSKLKESKPAQVAPTVPEGALDYDKDLEADPELIAKLKADREATNRAMYQQGAEQAKSIQFHTRLEIDAPRAEAKYPQLDKESDQFNPQLANAINTMYLEQVGYDQEADTVKTANLRYLPYVESIFELADEIAGVKTQDAVKNVAKQKAKTGLRPDGTSGKRLNLNKIPQAMTDEELDAIIAQAVPSK